MDTTRIGVIGTANTHAYQYVGLLNGWRSDIPFPQFLADGRPSGIMHQAFGTHLREASRLFPENVRFEKVRVTRLWSERKEEGELLERACGVRVVQEPHEVVHDVDAVMVLTEDPNLHLEHSTPALRAGLPTFIDKPLAGDDEQAQAIADLAKASGAPWFSSSTLRWAPGLDEVLQSIKANYGGVQSAYIQCPARASDYAIHAVEAMGKIMGSFDVANIAAVRMANSDVTVLDFADGRSATLENNGAVERMSYCGIFQSRLREHIWVEKDFGLTNVRFLRAFIEFIASGSVPVPPKEALAALAVTHRVQRALKYRR